MKSTKEIGEKISEWLHTICQESLFEVNEPILRNDIKERFERILYLFEFADLICEFKVVCDETNNPPEIVNTNKFVLDAYVKYASKPKFTQYNIIMKKSIVEFNELLEK